MEPEALKPTAIPATKAKFGAAKFRGTAATVGKLAAMAGRAKSAKTRPAKNTIDCDFIPEVRRRFQFDDTAVKRGGDLDQMFLQEQRPEEDFNEVVDQDDERVQAFVSQELVGAMIDSVVFRFVVIGIIVVNAILIGLQTDEKMSQDYANVFFVFDQVVLIIFISEILVKWYYGFWIFWKTGWNVLDFIIILALYLGPTLTFLGSSRILRILRVLRAFRSLRSISALAGLSLVVQTILQSIPDMTNIVLLLFIIMTVLAVIGVTMFGKEMPDRFGDLLSAMFSLFICVTQDGWVEIMLEFKSKGEFYHIGGAIYFFFAVMFGAFVFANLVVAVVVTNLELAMKEYKEEKKTWEDTLVTEVVHGDEHEHGAETREEVPLVDVKRCHKGFDASLQSPLEIVDFHNISADKLDKFFLILTVLEDNMVEYLRIREDLNKMFDVIAELNSTEVPEDDDEEEGDYGDILMGNILEEEDSVTSTVLSSEASKHSMALKDIKKGDILSNLIKLEGKHMLSTRDAHSMDAALRSVRSDRATLTVQLGEAMARITSNTNIRHHAASELHQKSKSALT